MDMSKKNRVFKYTRFSRFASKEGITDHELLEVVNQLEAEQADANLGGDVYKVRVARQGEGKSKQTSFARTPCYSVL